MFSLSVSTSNQNGGARVSWWRCSYQVHASGWVGTVANISTHCLKNSKMASGGNLWHQRYQRRLIQWVRVGFQRPVYTVQHWYDSCTILSMTSSLKPSSHRSDFPPLHWVLFGLRDSSRAVSFALRKSVVHMLVKWCQITTITSINTQVQGVSAVYSATHLKQLPLTPKSTRSS